jgi:hypothetical protein
MSSIDRQNKLLVSEDWKKIYQSFKNADFRSYDFDSLRRTMITYLRENYPEDFNDYIESSEFLSLLDLIAFLGQNLAFRFDLNARENFIELAERRESVLRLARLLSYSPKRSISANGLLKVVSVSTSESIIDSNGRDISEQVINWNDPTNSNWYEQFIKAINAALNENNQFGEPNDETTIEGVLTQQYKFNSTNTAPPVFSFEKNIDGRNMVFEIVSSSFKDSNKIYEEPPKQRNNFAALYRDDGRGLASSNTGFFCYFKQGSLQENKFTISRPSTNETVDIETVNVNNNDIWLYQLNDTGSETDLWNKVDSTIGNNVIYNSLSKDLRNIYSVLTRPDDKVRLVFADGVFGNLPQGTFKVYYRTSNGLTYSITPNSIRNVSIVIPYISKRGRAESITLTVSLKYTISNASEAESTDDIKTNAPAVYYTQNRMITGEDYNLIPASTNQEILKSKAVNRTSSGISRYFDLKDATGKYSNTNIFGDDGILYRETVTDKFSFTFNTLTDIESVLINQVDRVLSKKSTRDFYLANFPFRELRPEDLARFTQVTSSTNQSTGVLVDTATNNPIVLGDFTFSVFRTIKVGAMLKFTAPPGKVFSKHNTLIDESAADKNSKTFIWTKVVRIVGDGTSGVDNRLESGFGPVMFNEVVPTGAVLSTIIPRFITKLDQAVQTRAAELIFAQKEFALRYDQIESKWVIVSSGNVNKSSLFNLGKSGDQSGTQQDASWLIMFETDGKKYVVTYLGLRYVFESQQEVRFFFDSTDKVYDMSTGSIIKDKIKILGINTVPDNNESLGIDLNWEVVEEYKGADGYIDTKKLSVSFFDEDDDGVVDDPAMFDLFVNPSENIEQKIIFQQSRIGPDGVTDFYYYPEGVDLIQVFHSQDRANRANLSNGQLVFIVNESSVKQYNAGLPAFTIQSNYKGLVGRSNIKFQYIHAADDDSRIDPSLTNIIDIYILTRTYETEYKQWLRGELDQKPLPPSSDNLFISFSNEIEKTKSISDEIVYHPVKFKLLFGDKADLSLRASFKVVKNESLVVSDSEIKAGVIDAVNEFFSTENWNFGDTFYFAELSTYIMTKMAPRIANIVIVPVREDLAFGSLYEIRSNADEIFANCATVSDVEIIQEITATKIRSAGPVLTAVLNYNTGISSR